MGAIIPHLAKIAVTQFIRIISAIPCNEIQHYSP